MSVKRTLICTIAALAGMSALSARSEAFLDDATILIDRALNSPVITVRYSGAAASTVELLINGSSFGKRSVNTSKQEGETNFTIDLSALKAGSNDVEVRLIDKNGKIVGTQKTFITTDDQAKGPVYLSSPRMGATVGGPVEINLGFGREMRNVYVSFFIDNQFKLMTNLAPYSYVWDTTREVNGWHEVEAWVVDDASDTWKTRKVKVFVNNPGGNTKRRPPSKPANPATEAKPTPTPSAPKKPTPDLVPAANTGKAGASGETGVRNAALSTTKPSSSAPAAMAPRTALLRVAVNAFLPKVAGASDVKPASAAAPVAAGPKFLTPTGSRSATEPSKPFSAPQTSAALLPKPVATLPAAAATAPKPEVLAPSSTVGAVPSNPASNPVASAPAQPKPAAGAPATSVALTKPKAVTPAAPVVAKPVATKPAPTKPAPAKPVPTAPMPVSILRGTTLPLRGNYSILFDSKPILFGDVQPRVENGIPLTPFRHLFEQAGGVVKWLPDSKAVQAIGDGNEIYIKIGDKLARVNKLSVSLDVAPFLERGRTVVPLSFLNDALKVNVDYDPATGHVLITRKS